VMIYILYMVQSSSGEIVQQRGSNDMTKQHRRQGRISTEPVLAMRPWEL
jgi:hypothetical protein